MIDSLSNPRRTLAESILDSLFGIVLPPQRQIHSLCCNYWESPRTATVCSLRVIFRPQHVVLWVTVTLNSYTKVLAQLTTI